MRLPRMTTRRWMILVAAVAGLLLAIRSATYPTMWLRDPDWTEVRWSDGTVERHPGHVPAPTDWRNDPLWTLVDWSDGSVTLHLVPHLPLGARQWLCVIAIAAFLVAGLLELYGRIRRRWIKPGRTPGRTSRSGVDLEHQNVEFGKDELNANEMRSKWKHSESRPKIAGRSRLRDSPLPR
jgi:hypothetical protein